MTKVLWVVQVLLALPFMFAGGMKLVMPVEQMTRQAPVSLPGPFRRFIGVADVAGTGGGGEHEEAVEVLRAGYVSVVADIRRSC